MNFGKYAVLVIGGVLGGITGYYTGELLIDLMSEEDFVPVLDLSEEKEDLPEIEKPVWKSDDSSNVVKPIDYAKQYQSKESLEKLAAKYEPTQIVSAEYSHEFPWREPVTYYSDGIFTTANDEKIENAATLFGANIQNHFGEESGDPDVVYVHNKDLDTLYEITRVDDTFSHIVLGEEKPKKSRAKRG